MADDLSGKTYVELKDMLRGSCGAHPGCRKLIEEPLDEIEKRKQHYRQAYAGGTRSAHLQYLRMLVDLRGKGYANEDDSLIKIDVLEELTTRSQ